MHTLEMDWHSKLSTNSIIYVSSNIYHVVKIDGSKRGEGGIPISPVREVWPPTGLPNEIFGECSWAFGMKI